MRTLGFLIVFVASTIGSLAQNRPAPPLPAEGTARIRGNARGRVDRHARPPSVGALADGAIHTRYLDDTH